MAQSPSRRFLLSTAALAPLAAFPARATAPDADSELIRICAEHIVNMRTFNSSQSDLESDDDPLWHAYERTRDAIHDAEPQTIAGMVAKARAAEAEAMGANLNGDENPAGTLAECWAYDLVKDLLRLYGEGRA
jgi:hypothetical protein